MSYRSNFQTMEESEGPNSRTSRGATEGSWD